MFEDDNYSNKLKALLVSAVIMLIAVLIVSSSVSSALQSSIHIVNYGSGDTKSLLTEKELKAVKDAISDELAAHNTSGSDISIRWSSYSEPLETRKTFLVDLSNIRQTYQVTIISGNVWIDCPKPTQTLYPDSFCFTSSAEGNDSVDATIGDVLPYDGTIADGTKFRLYRNDQIGGLYVHIFACESEEKKKAAQEAVDNLIKSFRGNPAIFTYKYLFNNCNKK